MLPDLLIHETEPTRESPALKYVYSQDNKSVSIYEKRYDNFGEALWFWVREANRIDLTWIIKHLLDRFDISKNLTEDSKEVKKEEEEKVEEVSREEVLP